jgi:DNA polymerase
MTAKKPGGSRAPKSAASYLPDRRTLPALRAAAAECRGCELYKNATQTVFGAGPKGALILFVGEVPGNDEDLQGKPFVGPAGRLLREALVAAGIEPRSVYLTNAVKHFKFEPRGKRRLHKRPSSREVAACRPWLSAEFDAVKPKLVVCLGATAAQAVLGPAFRVTKNRCVVFDSGFGSKVMATVHPSSVLRAPDEESRRKDKKQFFDDLKTVASVAARLR